MASRKTRHDPDAWTARARQNYEALLTGSDPAPDPTPRVQREGTEQAALTAMARTRWWFPGYRHHEQARIVSPQEGARLKKRGVHPGWPDVTVHLPALTYRLRIHNGEFIYREQRVALELKYGDNYPTHGQIECLQLLEECGYAVSVQWGAENAIQWLDEVIGPEPSEPVQWPTYDKQSRPDWAKRRK